MMSMASCQASMLLAGSPMIGMIPALARTMSTRPNSDTPSSSTACTASMSRTSALRATMRAAELLDQLDRVGQVVLGGPGVSDAVELLADVEGDDVRSLLGQAHRVGAALPPGPPADEGDLAVEKTHANHSPGDAVETEACDCGDRDRVHGHEPVVEGGGAAEGSTARLSISKVAVGADARRRLATSRVEDPRPQAVLDADATTASRRR